MRWLQMQKAFHLLGCPSNCSCSTSNGCCLYLFQVLTHMDPTLLLMYLMTLLFKNPLILFVCVFQVTLRDSEPVVLVNSSCSCVAGSGMCNHLVALLYQTAHYSECGMSVVPPALPCTQTEQKWHKPQTIVWIN